MVLNLLWRDRCRAIPSVPPSLRRYLGAFRFPLVLLGCDEPGMRIRVAMAGDALIPGLSLADALCQELDIITDDGSLIIMIPEISQPTTMQDMRIVAELLHALILRDPRCPQQVPALFEWSFRSLSSSWLTDRSHGQQRARDQALADVLDFPASRAACSLPAYLRLLDPQHRAATTDHGLARRLARSSSIAEWQDTIWSSFESARSNRVFNLRHN